MCVVIASRASVAGTHAHHHLSVYSHVRASESIHRAPGIRSIGIAVGVTLVVVVAVVLSVCLSGYLRRKQPVAPVVSALAEQKDNK